jgi:hypothetical protein
VRVINDALLSAVVGSAGFWAPSIILYAFKGAELSLFRRWVVLAAVQPLTTLATFMTMRFLRRGSSNPSICAKWMLLGIWILGPFCMVTGFTVGGGGFANDGAWLDLLLATVLFPLLTPWLSLYDGSIVGLLLSSLLLAAEASGLRAILYQKFARGFSKLRTPGKGLACKSHSD